MFGCDGVRKMSSAALQTAPHQSSALPYTTSRSSPSREAYQSHQPTTAAPTSSRRPSSRKASGSAASPFAGSSSSMTDTAAATSYHHTDSQSYPADRSANMPPVAPPRTSSTQQSGSARKAAYANEKTTNSPRRGQADPSGRSSRSDANGSKRSANPHSQDSPARQTNSRDGRGAEVSMPIRTHEPSTPKSSRDHPENMPAHASPADTSSSRHVLAEYQGSPRPDDDAAPPPIASNDDRRGGRSRHDHNRSNRGTSKFGDFILGNTIGEGEFGKVKLGWKQDSSVQVRLKLGEFSLP